MSATVLDPLELLLILGWPIYVLALGYLFWRLSTPLKIFVVVFLICWIPEGVLW